MARRRTLHPLGPPARTNPRPAEWARLPADAPYDCKPYEAAWLGRFVPGHPGGTVVACATPSKRKPREGQLVVQTPKGKALVRRNVAKLRVRDRGSRTSMAREEIAANVEQARRRKPPALPRPPGVEYPHRRGSTVCDAEHPLWSLLEELQAETGERVAIELPELAGRPFRGEVYRRLKQTPTFRQAEDAERKCGRDFERREDLRDASRGAGRDADLRRWRRDYLRQGGDPNAPAYLDTLAPASRAKRLRAMGAAYQAREVEREARDAKKGRGRGRFRPG